MYYSWLHHHHNNHTAYLNWNTFECQGYYYYSGTTGINLEWLWKTRIHLWWRKYSIIIWVEYALVFTLYNLSRSFQLFVTQSKIKPVQLAKFGQHWNLLPGGKVIEFHLSFNHNSLKVVFNRQWWYGPVNIRNEVSCMTCKYGIKQWSKYRSINDICLRCSFYFKYLHHIVESQ